MNTELQWVGRSPYPLANELRLCSLFTRSPIRFDNIRNNGKKAITLKEDDELVSVKKTTGENEILMAGSNGRMVRFTEDNVRVMGRTCG